MLRRATLIIAAFIVVLFFATAMVAVGDSVHERFVAPPVLFAGPAVMVEVNEGHGSAVHIGHGLFITAAHVAKMAENGKFKVTTDLGTTFEADVLWINERYDVALIRAANPEPIKAARLACGAPELAVKAPVEIVGNPLNLRNIHTWGVVARSIFDTGNTPRTVFIADITIAPGNSGGPVFDEHGNLVGIVSAMAAAPMGPMSVSLIALSYIVPASTICTLLGQS